jgi:hypothetical protein
VEGCVVVLCREVVLLLLLLLLLLQLLHVSNAIPRSTRDSLADDLVAAHGGAGWGRGGLGCRGGQGLGDDGRGGVNWGDPRHWRACSPVTTENKPCSVCILGDLTAGVVGRDSSRYSSSVLLRLFTAIFCLIKS